jgi:radical SAM superfamily enzyme YgiQ (UPF0313 family)
MDLADDAELMALMSQANIGAVFVGIESPNEDALRETRKLQNVRPGGSMIEKIRRIQDAGMEVWGGMIVGFDSDDESVFEAQRNFIAAARVSTAMIGMLSAIPKTPLHARLAAAGRLDPDDEPAYGTNVVPLRMSRQALSQGYVRLMADLYRPEAYFGRFEDLYLAGAIDIDRAWRTYARRHPWRRRARHALFWAQTAGLLARLQLRVPDAGLRGEYRRRFWKLLRRRRDPAVLRVYAIKCAMHYHTHRLVQALSAPDRAIINTY